MEEKIRLTWLLKIINNIFERELNNRTSKLELTPSQCSVLAFLNGNNNKEINPVHIEKEFCLKRPTVTGILQRLEEKGFIKIVQSEEDKRYKKISLTEKSNEAEELMTKNLNDMEQILYKNLTNEDKEELNRILNIMFKNLTE